MESGVLLVNGGGLLEFADARACELLGFEDPVQLQNQWDDVRARLRAALIRPGERVSVDAGSNKGKGRCVLTAFYLPEAERYLIRISEDLPVDRDRLHATQLRSLATLRRSVEHQFRGMLNALALNVELLRGEVTAKAPDSEDGNARQTRYLAMLAKEVARLPDSLSTVLKRIEPIGSATQRFDLRQLIEAVRDIVGAQARVHRVTLRLTLPDSEVIVDGNHGYLQQALVNLCLNSLAAMPSGGALDIELGVGDGYASVKVKDNGRGMPKEYFDERSPLPLARRAMGSGLYVVVSAVAQLGGTMHITSVEGEGTVVDLRIPIVPRS